MAKAEPLPEEGAKLQAFLDNQQYGISSILKYERVFGEHFISPGGKETTEVLVFSEPGYGDHFLSVQFQFFFHLKLELLMQCQASNKWKMFPFMKYRK